ncbi:MAG: protein kinase [Myxococcota bacterium]|nr:protein kinase [Myxococcota bacterium]MDW8361549.1 protein kinase [Myxococcales bacterium]
MPSTRAETLERFPTLAGWADTIEHDPRATIVPAGTDRPEDPVRWTRAAAALGLRMPDVELGETLGEGGMGVVRLGVQRSLRRRVAVKTLRDSVRDERAAAKLLREAWITGALEHPNVVPVYDLGLGTDGHPVLVMKRIEGIAWSALIADARLLRERHDATDPLEWHLQVLQQLCHAVSHAHARGIVHRDIKPDNVMIGPFGEVYLLDWGIALVLPDRASSMLVEEVGGAHELAGTPCYMAPEMLGGPAARIDERTDVYLLGAVLHEIVTGQPPHLGGELAEIVASIVRSRPALGPDVPEELARIVERAMDPDPAGRFQSAEQLRLALVGFVRHRGSVELTHRAERLLEGLQAQAAAARDEEALRHLAERYDEVRYRFRHALESWPDNERARRGLREAALRMAEGALARGDAEAARRHLDEVEAPPAELRERIERALQTARREQERLAALGRLHDPRIGQRTRTVLAVLVGTIWTLLPVVLGLLDPDLDYPSMFAVPLVLVALLLALGRWARESMTRTLFNRRAGWAAVAALLAQSAFTAAGLALGLPPETTQRLWLLEWHVAAVLAAVFLHAALLVPALAYAAGFFVAARWPETTWAVMAATNGVLTLTVARVWAPQVLRELRERTRDAPRRHGPQ